MPESRWLRDRLTLTGLMIVSSFLVLAIAAPVIAPYNPAGIDPAHRLEGISSAHIFGTDNLGRDLFSRMAYGARWSLGAAALATAAIVCLGVVVGTAAGYKGGRTSNVLMRTVDVVLAFPSLARTGDRRNPWTGNRQRHGRLGERRVGGVCTRRTRHGARAPRA